jgi:hypothetical protein
LPKGRKNAAVELSGSISHCLIRIEERSGGDQLVAELVGLVALDEGEEPVGEIGGSVGGGGGEECDDPPLGIGHGRTSREQDGSWSLNA